MTTTTTMTPDELKQERVKRGLSIRHAGKIQKVTWQYLSKLENNRANLNGDRAELIMMRYRDFDEAQAREREHEADTV